MKNPAHARRKVRDSLSKVFCFFSSEKKIFLLFLFLTYSPAQAHLSSGSYLRLTLAGPAITASWDISLRDLDTAIGLDNNGDGNITWGEVRARRSEIAAYATSHLAITTAAGACLLRPTAQLIDQHADGGYVVLRLVVDCPAAARVLTLRYRLLFDLDPTHRGLLTVNDHGAIGTAILSPERPTYTIVPGAAASTGFWSFLRLGIFHILGGRDHLLFLAVLLAPALAQTRRRGLAGSLADTAGLLSLFTAAHAVTVSLAALGIIDVPARVSEAAIAFSIAVTAADNVRPSLGPRRGAIAFGFGLIHGLGFASALGPLDLTGWALIAALAGFNAGIELVQLGLATLAFAAAWLLPALLPAGAVFPRARHAGRLLPLCSVAILLLSVHWFVDRSFLQVPLR
jgi:hypothetical protein